MEFEGEDPLRLQPSLTGQDFTILLSLRGCDCRHHQLRANALFSLAYRQALHSAWEK